MADVPTPVALKIQGIAFAFTPRYSEGHVLTEEEAKVLNQTLGENLRNNFATRIRAKEAEIAKAAAANSEPARGFTAEEIAQFKADFAAYEAEYTFRAPRVGSGPADPVQREANRIAKSIVLAALSARKIEVKSLGEGKMDELVARVIATKPEVMDEARRRVAAIQEAGDDILGDALTQPPAAAA